jgi:glycerophosphoryl diester phosphodiesterase
MNSCFSLSDICNGACGLVVTAHRGASYAYPENTVPAMEQAVAAGAHIIEFDLRMTRDGIPVVLHDQTIDRTSDGVGTPESHTLAELRNYNFSRYVREARQEEPVYEHLEIPAFEDILKAFRGRACMNIQIYVGDGDGLDEVCRLYRQYDMYDYGYLTIAGWNMGEKVKSIDSRIDICMTPGWLERVQPDNLRKCRDFGCRFVQPVREACTPETFELCRELGLRENVFYADAPDAFTELIRKGARGIMTNRPDRLGDFLKTH